MASFALLLSHDTMKHRDWTHSPILTKQEPIALCEKVPVPCWTQLQPFDQTDKVKNHANYPQLAR